jgi:hypothetical protein
MSQTHACLKASNYLAVPGHLIGVLIVHQLRIEERTAAMGDRIARWAEDRLHQNCLG